MREGRHNGHDMGSVLWAIVGQEAGDVTIIKSFDPFGWEIEPCSDWQFEVGEVHVFSIPFRLLVVCLLVFGNFISEPSQLLTKLVFHLMVGCLTGSNGFKEFFTDVLQGDSIDIIADGIEGCGDCVGQQWLAA
jgi:hypothetical protein